MKVIIECDPDVDNKEEAVFNQFKEWCEMAFGRFKLEIEGTNFKAEK